MDRFSLALTILIAAFVLSRLVSERGLKVLSAEQKGRVIEGMTSFRKFGTVLLLVLLLLAFKNPAFLVAGVAIFVVVHLALISRQAQRLSLPSRYLKTSVASAVLTLAGMAAYLVVLFAPWPV